MPTVDCHDEWSYVLRVYVTCWGTLAALFTRCRPLSTIKTGTPNTLPILPRVLIHLEWPLYQMSREILSLRWIIEQLCNADSSCDRKVILMPEFGRSCLARQFFIPWIVFNIQDINHITVGRDVIFRPVWLFRLPPLNKTLILLRHQKK